MDASKTISRKGLGSRAEELRREIARLAARVEHLAAEGLRVEKGLTDRKERFEGAGELKAREEVLRFQPAAAVGYWRELREQEERLDALRRELRSLEELGTGDELHVYIHYDGQDGQDGQDGPGRP